MLRNSLPVQLLVLAMFSTAANAELSIGGSIENYRWAETIANAPLTPKETGLRLAANLKWTKDGDHGLLFGYRGKLYFGQVHFDTYTQLTYKPVSTNTVYVGTAHEGQLLYRTDAGQYKLDYVGGLGYDSWLRSINNHGFYQNEEYRILFLRGGINIGQSTYNTGFHGGGGLKYPFWTEEDAYLKKLGYYSNPIITPGKDYSFYADLGYRISERWDMVGYYDSWRFKKSNTVYSASPGGAGGVPIWQPESSMDTFGLRAMHSF